MQAAAAAANDKIAKVQRVANYLLAGVAVYAIAAGTAVCFMEVRPVWPLGLSFGAGYSGALFLMAFAVYVPVRLLPNVFDVSRTVAAGMVATLAGQVLAFATAVVLGANDEHVAAAGVMWAADVPSAVFFCWCLFTRGGTSACFGATSAQILPV